MALRNLRNPNILRQTYRNNNIISSSSSNYSPTFQGTTYTQQSYSDDQLKQMLNSKQISWNTYQNLYLKNRMIEADRYYNSGTKAGVYEYKSGSGTTQLITFPDEETAIRYISSKPGKYKKASGKRVESIYKKRELETKKIKLERARQKQSQESSYSVQLADGRTVTMNNLKELEKYAEQQNKQFLESESRSIERRARTAEGRRLLVKSGIISSSSFEPIIDESKKQTREISKQELNEWVDTGSISYEVTEKPKEVNKNFWKEESVPKPIKIPVGRDKDIVNYLSARSEAILNLPYNIQNMPEKEQNKLSKLVKSGVKIRAEELKKYRSILSPKANKIIDKAIEQNKPIREVSLKIAESDLKKILPKDTRDYISEKNLKISKSIESEQEKNIALIKQSRYKQPIRSQIEETKALGKLTLLGGVVGAKGLAEFIAKPVVSSGEIIKAGSTPIKTAKSEYSRFTKDPLGTTAEYYTFGKLANIKTYKSGYKKISEISKDSSQYFKYNTPFSKTKIIKSDNIKSFPAEIKPRYNKKLIGDIKIIDLTKDSYYVKEKYIRPKETIRTLSRKDLQKGKNPLFAYSQDTQTLLRKPKEQKPVFGYKEVYPGLQVLTRINEYVKKYDPIDEFRPASYVPEFHRRLGAKKLYKTLDTYGFRSYMDYPFISVELPKKQYRQRKLNEFFIDGVPEIKGKIIELDLRKKDINKIEQRQLKAEAETRKKFKTRYKYGKDQSININKRLETEKPSMKTIRQIKKDIIKKDKYINYIDFQKLEKYYIEQLRKVEKSKKDYIRQSKENKRIEAERIYNNKNKDYINLEDLKKRLKKSKEISSIPRIELKPEYIKEISLKELSNWIDLSNKIAKEKSQKAYKEIREKIGEIRKSKKGSLGRSPFESIGRANRKRFMYEPVVEESWISSIPNVERDFSRLYREVESNANLWSKEDIRISRESPKIKSEVKIKQKKAIKKTIKLETKIKSILKRILNIKTKTKTLSKQQILIKQKLETILKRLQKLKVKLKTKTKQISKTITITKKIKAIRIKAKPKPIRKKLKPSFKPKLKTSLQIKLPIDKRRKIIDKALKQAKKKRKFIYLPDLTALVRGERAGKKEKLRYIDPRTVFTGLEARKLI